MALRASKGLGSLSVSLASASPPTSPRAVHVTPVVLRISSPRRYSHQHVSPLPVGPKFFVSPGSVTPLATPSQFYDALLAGVRTSRQRITIATLYLGNGHLEQDLVAAIKQQCAREPALEVCMQLDHSRALRRMGKPHVTAPATAPPAAEQPAGLSAAAAPSVLCHHGAYDSSAHLLLELFRRPGSGARDPDLQRRVRVGLTLLPQLRGLLGRLAPPRVIEAAGVWHMKAYVFDEHTVILSGANLSHDYFTSRQDRYVVIGGSNDSGSGSGSGSGKQQEKARGLADGGVAAFARYLHTLVADVGTLPGAFSLQANGEVTIKSVDGKRELPTVVGGPASAVATASKAASSGSDGGAATVAAAVSPLPSVRHAPVGDPVLHNSFTEGLKELLRSYSRDESRGMQQPPTADAAADTAAATCTLQPRLQLGVVNARYDQEDTLQLLHSLRPAPADILHMATGYFNLPAAFTQPLVDPAAKTCVHILTADPKANGFFGAKGISGAIPAAYSEIEKRFYESAARAGRLMRKPEAAPQEAGVALHEYARDGWTFHAKGLWLHRRNVAGTANSHVITLVGSPNFGVRSVERDLELQVHIDSHDAGLSQRLLAERDLLFTNQQNGSSSATAVAAAAPTGAASAEEAAAAAARAAAPVHVMAVGPHLGPDRDVWQLPHRIIGGWTWAQGWWIHLGGRLLAAFF